MPSPRNLRSGRRQAADPSEPSDSDLHIPNETEGELAEYPSNDNRAVIMDSGPESSRSKGKQPQRKQHPLRFPPPEETGGPSSSRGRSRNILQIDRSPNREDYLGLSPLRESMPPDGLDEQVSGRNQPRNIQGRPVESSPERNPSDRQASEISRRSHYSTGRTPPRRYVARPREPPEFELAIRHLKRAKESVRKLKDDGKFEPLKGKANYRHWADNMEQLFDDNAVTAIVYGEIIILPREHRHQMLQAQYVSFARKAINNHISKQIQQYLQDRGLRNPAEMWKALRTSYAPTNASVASDGVDDLAALRLSDCTSFDQYKFRFQTAWTKIFSNGRNEDERFKCLLFLRFIDTDTWSNWKINFKSRVSASSNPDEIYQFEKLTGELEDVDKTLNEERKSTAYSTKTSDARGNKSNKTKDKKKCDHCNKPGHKKESCYFLYPEKRPEKAKVTDSYVTQAIHHSPPRKMPQAVIQALATETSMPPIDRWICDTASDDHMISSPHYFIPGTVSPITTRISTATSERSVNGLTGDVVLVLVSPTKGKEARMKLTRVMWYPSLRINLLSGDKLAKHGVTAFFEPELLTFIRKDRSVLGTGRKSGKQWLLNVKSIEPQRLSQGEVYQTEIREITKAFYGAPNTVDDSSSLPSSANLPGSETQLTQNLHPKGTPKRPIPSIHTKSCDDPPRLDKSRVNINTWHRRLGHLGTQGVRKTARIVDGIDIKGLPVSKQPCGDCAIGRAVHKPRRAPVLHRSTKPGELVYVDIGGGGKLKPAIETGARYWLLMIDDYDGWAEVRFLRSKSAAEHAIKDLVTQYEKDRQCKIGEFVTPHQINTPETNSEIGGIQSDNGGEFVYHKLQDWAKTRGIPWYFIAPYAHEQNGKIERLMRIVGERMRCLLADSKLPQFLWAEVMKTVVMVRNMTFYNGRKLAEREPTTPYEMRYGRKPDISFLRIIGSKVWKLFPKEAIQQSPKGRHLAHRAELGFLTGYSSYNGSQYRVYRPFQNPPKSGGTMHTVRDAIIDEGPDWDLYNNPDLPIPTCVQQRKYGQKTQATVIEHSDHENSDAPDHGDYLVLDNEIDGVSESESEDPVQVMTTQSTEHVEPTTAPRPATVSRSHRAKIQELENTTTVLWTENHQQKAPLPVLPSPEELAKTPAKWFESPESLSEAKGSPFWPWWYQAMKSEISQFEILGVWKPVRPPKGAKVLTGRWVFKLKADANGRPVKFKARWVARGNNQREGVDFEEAYAATGRYETLRVVLAVIALRGLHTKHMDVNLAYLNAKLDETIYMRYPDGFESNGLSCLLLRSLYGLRQSAANWYKTLSKFLISRGFKSSSADPCLYVRHEQGGGIIIVFVYVDDILLAASTHSLLQVIKEAISTKWSTSDLGELSHYLSLKILHDRTKGLVQIGQKAYVDKFQEPSSGVSPKPLTPMHPDEIFTKSDEQIERSQRKDYQSLTGSLMYASTVSRPDLALSLGILTKFNQNPDESHILAAQRATQYAKRTSSTTIVYGRARHEGNTGAKDGMGLWGCVDASFGSDPDTLRSRTGWVFFLAGAPISWSSKQQTCVTKSSAEAEYYALSDAGSQALWLQRLLLDLRVHMASEPVHLYCDSQSAISMTNGQKYSRRSRHIEVHHHWIREKVQNGKIRISHIPGTQNIADGFTKPLPKPAFEKFMKSLSLKSMSKQ